MPTPAPYVQLRCTHTDARDAVQALLTDYDVLGFLDEDASWSCYFTTAAWEAHEAAIRTLLHDSFPTLQFEVETIAPQNWNAEWEESIQPIRVSDRFIIAPSWHPVEASDNVIVLTIDPKMSFGTGYHETTRLMLRLMGEVEMQGRRALDVGTGTGVLAIAARRCGAVDVLGVDIDVWSYDNAEENRHRNGIDTDLEFREGTVEESDGIFDVILSNITRNDNIGLMAMFARMTRAGSDLLLSGFYGTDLEDMTHAARGHGFETMRSLSENEWCAVHLRRIATI
jgi:ribosomal protein L11 methyltransferase